MNILATNDDGVTSPGLLALTKELKKSSNLKILAPDRNWSGTGYKKTIDRPIRTKNIHLSDGTRVWTCDGTPADCVSMAILGYFSEKFDLVVAGIDPTENFGFEIIHSGTLAAAMEAVLWGVTGIAFSINTIYERYAQLNYQSAAKAARNIIEKIYETNLPPGLLLNVNIPNIPYKDINGCKITHLGKRIQLTQLDLHTDPFGKPYYWISGAAPVINTDNGSDYQAVIDGYISISPIQIDLTDYSSIQALDRIKWLDEKVNDYRKFEIDKWSMVFDNLLQTV